MSRSVRMMTRRSASTMVRKSMSDRSFRILPTACLPPDVFDPLVEIVATIERSSLTASKSKTPPERSRSRSPENFMPKWVGIQLRLTQSSTSAGYEYRPFKLQGGGQPRTATLSLGKNFGQLRHFPGSNSVHDLFDGFDVFHSDPTRADRL